MKTKKKLLLLSLLILLSNLITILLTQKIPSEKNNTNTDNNTNPIDNNSDNNTNIDPVTPDSDEEKKDNITIDNKTDYDPINDKSSESENIYIDFYKSPINRTTLVKGYQGFIELKDEFYRKTFAEFDHKFKPENEEYRNTIYHLSFFWYMSAGLVGVFFVAYVILRLFFGKFKGAKDIDQDDKILPWVMFCNFFFLNFV